MTEPFQLSVRLCPQTDLVLDLWKGFSSPIRFCFINDGDNPMKFAFPLLRNSHEKVENDEIDIIRALTQGSLEIRDDGGNKISTECVTALELPELEDILWFFKPREQIVFPLTNPTSNLLRLFRSMFKAGKTYRFQLSQNNAEQISRPLIHHKDDRKLFPPFSMLGSLDSSSSIPFSVVSGTPIPRFIIAISTSSFICSLSGAPQFRITLTITSISEQPITVALCLDSYVKIPPQNITHKWKNGGFQSLFSIKDRKSQLSVSMTKRERKNNSVSCENFSSAEDFIYFRKGTQHIRHFVFDQEDLDQFRPSRSYDMKLKRQGFATWHYGLKCKKVNAYWTTEWCRNGPIFFEPASAAGLAVEAALERGRPMPFFWLPCEIRNHIYDYLKFHENSDVVHFKTLT